MKTHKIGENMKEETRIALLEQSIGHINETLLRLESKIDKLDGKLDSRFIWLITMGIGAFAGLFGMMAHAMHWF